MGKYLKIKKECEIYKHQSQKNPKLRRKTAIKIESEFCRKKMHSFIVDTMPKVD